MSRENLVEFWLEKESVMSTIYSKAMEEIEDNLLPIGMFPDSMSEIEDEGKEYKIFNNNVINI